MGIQDNKTMNEAITSSTMASKTGGTPLSATPLSGRRSKMSLVHSQSAASVPDGILLLQITFYFNLLYFMLSCLIPFPSFSSSSFLFLFDSSR